MRKASQKPMKTITGNRSGAKATPGKKAAALTKIEKKVAALTKKAAALTKGSKVMKKTTPGDAAVLAKEELRTIRVPEDSGESYPPPLVEKPVLKVLVWRPGRPVRPDPEKCFKSPGSRSQRRKPFVPRRGNVCDTSTKSSW